MNIKLDIKDHSKLSRGFVDIKKANEIATKNTLNLQAALTRKNAIKRVSENFTLRNDFTVKAIAYDRVKTNDISTMQSAAGALKQAEYLKLQHEGGVRKSRALFKQLAIPQLAARGGSKKRLVSKSMYLKMLEDKMVKSSGRPHTVHGKRTSFRFNLKERLVARAYVAYTKKLYMKHNQGIYAVTSFTKSKRKIGFKMKHIYSLPKKPAMVRKNSWLWDSAQQPAKDGQSIYNSQVKKLLAQKKDYLESVMDKNIFLKNLWCWKCGLPEINYFNEDYMQLKKTEWSKDFEQLMRNRLIVGAMRYGKLNANDKKNYDRIKSIEKELKLYQNIKNKEILVDIANLCLVEFEEGQGVFNALDDSEHTKIKGE